MPAAPTIFLDRSMGRHDVAEALREAEMRVEIHDDHFPMDAEDEVWLSVVGKRGWLCLTKDVRIGRSLLQRLWVAKHGVRLFAFMSGSLTGPEMGEVIAKACARMLRMFEQNEAPFIAKVYASGQVKLWRDRATLVGELARQ